MFGPKHAPGGVVAALRKNWMMVGVALAIILARQDPSIGAKGGAIRPEYTMKYGAVALIFLISGVGLRPDQLGRAVSNVRLHCAIQGFTLVVVPCLAYFFVAPALRALKLNPWLVQGILAMSTMPPPVSSAVILTKAAGANEAAAIFNSAFGSLLGIFVTPVELLLVCGSSMTMTGGGGAAQQGGAAFADKFAAFAVTLASIFQQLTLTVLVPLVVGQVARPRLEAWLDRTRPPLSEVSQLTLLLIIYTTFCDSFNTPGAALDRADALAMGAVALFVVLWQLTLLALVFHLFADHRCRIAAFQPPDVVAALFCATHKSLTLGIPVLNIVFAGHRFLSFITAPLLMYHPVQIVLGGLLVPAVRAWMIKASSSLKTDLEAGTIGGS